MNYSYFSKATAKVFDKIDNGTSGFLPSSKYVELIETIGGGGRSDELEGHLQKVYPNESSSLDRFAFVRWYVDKEVSLDSVEEVERFVGWGYKVILIDIQ